MFGTQNISSRFQRQRGQMRAPSYRVASPVLVYPSMRAPSCPMRESLSNRKRRRPALTCYACGQYIQPDKVGLSIADECIFVPHEGALIWGILDELHRTNVYMACCSHVIAIWIWVSPLCAALRLIATSKKRSRSNCVNMHTHGPPCTRIETYVYIIEVSPFVV